MNCAASGLRNFLLEFGLKVKSAVLDWVVWIGFFVVVVFFTHSPGSGLSLLGMWTLRVTYCAFFLISLLKNNDDKLCLICHEKIRRNSGGAQELHCTHRFHKEVRHLVRGTACLLLHALFCTGLPFTKEVAPCCTSATQHVSYQASFQVALVSDVHDLHRG